MTNPTSFPSFHMKGNQPWGCDADQPCLQGGTADKNQWKQMDFGQFLWFFFDLHQWINYRRCIAMLPENTKILEKLTSQDLSHDTNQPQDAIVREHLERLGEKAIGWWGFPSTWESRWYFFTLGMVRGDVWSWDFDWNLLQSTWCLYGL